MKVKFLFKFFDYWAEKRQITEILSFIKASSTLSDQEMGELLIWVAYAKMQMAQIGNDVSCPQDLWIKKPHIILEVSRMAVKFKSQGNIAAFSAYSVWVHTLRSVTRASLLPLGKLMWRELSRGFPHVPLAANNFYKSNGVMINISDATEFPFGIDSVQDG